jgi:hypothetical protein
VSLDSSSGYDSNSQVVKGNDLQFSSKEMTLFLNKQIIMKGKKTMSQPPAFKTKKNYELVKKYLGKPPCDSCIIRIGCFQMEKSPIDGYWEVYFHKDPCNDAYIWFRYGVFLGGNVEWWIKTNDKLLNSGAEQIKKECRRIVLEFMNIDPKHYFGE